MNPVADAWKTDLPLPDYRAAHTVRNVVHRYIHESHGDYRFLLGVSIVEHKGALVAAWGASARDENDAASIFAFATSADGANWSAMKPVAPKPAGADAHSHGVLLSAPGALWAFAPRARFGDIMEYPELRMEAFRFDETAQAWTSQGESAPGFWPLCEPQRMADGNWIIGGAMPHRAPHCDAAVAISAGDDLTRWTVVEIPSREVTWGETTVLADGPVIRAFIRPASDGAALRTAMSWDFGRTWGVQTNSNLPVSAAKPYAGRLSDGTSYLLANIPVPGLGARDTLAIFLSRPGASVFSDVRIIRQGPSPAPRTSGAAIGRQWAYPYAIEWRGKLLVVYASTKENAELSIVDVAELTGSAGDR